MVTISLERAKRQLRIDDEYNGDDALLEGYIVTASSLVAELTIAGSSYDLDPSQRPIAEQAVAMLVDFMYTGNEAMDKAARALCAQIRRYNV